MPQFDWGSLVGGIIMQCVPLYIILQAWFGCAWAGRWRLAALVPLIGFVPTLIISLIDLSRGSNLWPITMILFAPVGFAYLLVLGLARMAVRRRGAR
jgi:hypothetical protein